MQRVMRTVIDEHGTKSALEIQIVEDVERTAPVGVALRQEWCGEDHDETNDFLCYPEDGACPCGEFKHHVHCAHGAIIQTG